jgi:transcriptional regulator of acetoin/glycerol metabolism
VVSRFDEGSADVRTRPEIVLSWQRTRLAGLAPDMPISDLPVAEYDPTSSLLRAAGPVLDRMTAKLEGTRYSLLLADRDCKLVYRWFDEASLELVLDAMGARNGARLSEDSVGTNAVGTAYETRAGITVHGGEHFVEPFKRFSCYGHPIKNPVTRRLEGVLDITGITADANPLLAPFLLSAVDDIEQRLLDTVRASERTLLAAFHAASQVRHRAVAALGSDVALTNKAALDLLSPADYAVMRMLMDDLDARAEHAADVALASGVQVRISLARIAGAGEGTLFHIDPVVPVRRIGTITMPRPGRGVVSTQPVLISGEPGTGRTTEARRCADAEPISAMSCADITIEGEQTWGCQLADRLRSTAGSVVIEAIDLLPDALSTLVIDSINSATGPRLIFTSGPFDTLIGLPARLAALCVNRVDLVPLRHRGAEMPEIAARLLREINPMVQVRLVPTVIETLSGQAWPGNLHELKAVLARVIERRTAGDVTVADLPEQYRVARQRRSLSGRERAERDAIIAALRECNGNKVQAARELGISRTTLYARMRALKITGF